VCDLFSIGVLIVLCVNLLLNVTICSSRVRKEHIPVKTFSGGILCLSASAFLWNSLGSQTPTIYKENKTNTVKFWQIATIVTCTVNMFSGGLCFSIRGTVFVIVFTLKVF